MPLFTTIEGVKKHINVSKNLDIKLLMPYKVEALNKIYEFIPQDIFEEIETTHPEIFTSIERAAANYMVAFSIPFIKIHISNTGGQNFDDNKLTKADWWDIRDFGIAAVKIADKALSKAINLLLNTTLKSQLTFLNSKELIITTPQEFSDIYEIGSSWDVFKRLVPLMKNSWKVYLSNQLTNCTIEEIKADEDTNELLKSIVAYFTISDAITEPTLLFTNTGIVIQWEELPWQKSQVLDFKNLELLSKKYLKKANDLLVLLHKELKYNPEKFPCYQFNSTVSQRATIAKKSGLYL